MKTTILVIEDELAIQELIVATLNYAGYKVIRANDVDAANSIMKTIQPDLIVCDWMMPGQSGISLIRQLRANTPTQAIPIIMLTARAEDHDAVFALESGADDFITKPFSPRQLVARIHALLRRRAPHLTSDVITVGAFQLNPVTRSLKVAGQAIELSATEFRLLHFFMAQPGRVHKRSHLLDSVWSMNTFLEERTVDAHVGRLRSALQPSGQQMCIETVRGLGYRFNAETNENLPQALATSASSPDCELN